MNSDVQTDETTNGKTNVNKKIQAGSSTIVDKNVSRDAILNDPKTIYVKNTNSNHYILENNVTIVTRHKDNTYTIYDEKGPRRFSVDDPPNNYETSLQALLSQQGLYMAPPSPLESITTTKPTKKTTKTTVQRKEKEDKERLLAQQGIFMAPQDNYQYPMPHQYPYPHPYAGYHHPYPPAYPYGSPYGYPYSYPPVNYHSPPPPQPLKQENRTLSPLKPQKQQENNSGLKPALKKSNLTRKVVIDEKPQIVSYDDDDIPSLMKQLPFLWPENSPLKHQVILPPIKTTPIVDNTHPENTDPISNNNSNSQSTQAVNNPSKNNLTSLLESEAESETLMPVTTDYPETASPTDNKNTTSTQSDLQENHQSNESKEEEEEVVVAVKPVIAEKPKPKVKDLFARTAKRVPTQP